MKNSNRASWILSIAFWAIIIVIIGIMIYSSNEKHTLKEYFIMFFLFGAINLLTYFVNYTILIPELIKKRTKYAWYILAFILAIMISTGIKYIIAIYNPEETLNYLINGKKIAIKPIAFIINKVFISGFFMVVSSIIKFVVYWYENDQNQKELEREKKDMELQFLKSQLNPHFLFNSLNNIYSLAYQKSEKTADAIMKLSEIMRYMIYESNDSWVSLEKEIDYLKSFIDLQNLRFKNGAAIEINIKGEIDGQRIVPLLLFTFVENAFKHGVVNDFDNPIKINLIANQKLLHFTVMNKKNKSNKDAIGGVGLSNVERRLQLLYSDKHKLNVNNTSNNYTIELILDL